MKSSRSVIPKSVRSELDSDPKKDYCAFEGVAIDGVQHVCGGRITREHALYYAGRKIQDRFAIIFLCARGHGVDEYQDNPGQVPKPMREWAALSQGTQEDFDRFPRKFPSFAFELNRLTKRYGKYVHPMEFAIKSKQ